MNEYKNFQIYKIAERGILLYPAIMLNVTRHNYKRVYWLQIGLFVAVVKIKLFSFKSKRRAL